MEVAGCVPTAVSSVVTSDQATLVIATSLLPNLQLVSGGGVEMARGAHTDCKQAAAELSSPYIMLPPPHLRRLNSSYRINDLIYYLNTGISNLI